MTRKTTFIISAALSAFILVVVGALAGQVAARTTTTQDQAAGLPGSADPIQTGFTESDATGYPISAPDALLLAQAAAPNARLQGNPELVSFEGNVAYEVVTNLGSFYIDANTGQMLYNPTAQQTVARSGEHENEEHEFEHEDSDDD